MALITMNYNSPTIGMHQNLTIILPEDVTFFDSSRTAKQLKSMLLLHGLSSDETTYIRYTSIERYANEHQLAIIMPNVDHSGYANMVYGHSYYDYILEIYEYVHQILPLSRKREDNFIAGHSMGGYGTIKFALTQSDKFAKAAPLSAVFEAQRLIDLDWIDFSPQAITGRDTQIKGTELDAYYLLDQAIDASVDIPELFIMCGKEDFLYHDNLQFIETLNKKGVSYKFEDGPGDHDYAYWDRAIKRAIEWFVQ
ncbi:alpha/beta hydrolase [Staphylococcus epidermidis]|uniref:alpha/beta hydrolase n=1 Tax=Staphylococcus epidermidis TaxID=1282 RepID=UPI001E56204F|nr:alpha/beta hydrolase family protein [Staphylococcus epidermidis]MCD8922956.1 esterase family protein [Staphylococcus epidermidis]MCD9057461.1 esterase family protein [Staphylococcus epidermidis]MEB5737358.1 esterase family protein [Staphylococcus epidermidis]MEB7071496.1 esterase family protein [Staphylococcus epidermidis]MEB7387362.1 esterase family protein [Staphylococcus epidermidis]